MRIYDEFCFAAAGAVRNATAQERNAIRQELREHLEDHAAALMEDGLSAEEAARAAVNAMGDPAEIGKAINQAYPLRWRILSRFSLLCAIVLVCLLYLPMWTAIGILYTTIDDNLYARQMEPFTSYGIPLDLKATVKGQVFRVWGMEYRIQNGAPAVELCCVTYNRLPWGSRSSQINLNNQTFSVYDENGTVLPFLYGSTDRVSSVSSAYIASDYIIPVEETTQKLILDYQRMGESFTLTIPIDWSAAQTDPVKRS